MNGKAAREKGARTERAVASYLRERGFTACKRNVDRREDEGDLLGLRDAVDGGIGAEIKAQAVYRFGDWLRQAADGCERAGLRYPVCVVKPRGVARAEDYWVVTRLSTFCDVITAS